jgi:hypothetical protein
MPLASKSLVDGTSSCEGYAIMKIGIVGAGRGGSACALAAVVRGSSRDIVIVDRTRKRAKAVATDLLYGSPLCPKTTTVDGDYDDLKGAALVMVTAGINEKAGGATDRSDPHGRLRLLDTNAEIYRDIVPRIVRAAPGAVILVVTDPPDPLADIARVTAGHDRVLSTGTFWIAFDSGCIWHGILKSMPTKSRPRLLENTASRRCSCGRAPALPVCRSAR